MKQRDQLRFARTFSLLEDSEYFKLQLVGTRLHTEFKKRDRSISFIITGNHSGSTLDVRTLRPVLLKEIQDKAAEYMRELAPYFVKRKTRK